MQLKFSFQKAEIKECNVMINGKNLFDQVVKENPRTYNNIQKIMAGQGDDLQLVVY